VTPVGSCFEFAGISGIILPNNTNRYATRNELGVLPAFQALGNNCRWATDLQRQLDQERAETIVRLMDLYVEFVDRKYGGKRE
jgi:hypothetical protein